MKSIETIIRNLRVAMTDARQNESHFESWMILNEAICDAIDALAEQALDKMAENARELGLDYEPIIERVEDAVGMGHNAWDMVKPTELAKAFHEALAEQDDPDLQDKDPELVEQHYKQVVDGVREVFDAKRKQPAQQQEPVGWMHWLHGPVRLFLNKDEAQMELERLNREYPVDVGSRKMRPLVFGDTSPPASKPWVGLTEEDMDWLHENTPCIEGNYGYRFIRAIEAKLREKNA